jgi:hypothetical protein
MTETTAQCQGVTKSGSRCKNSVQEGSSFCHLHQDQAAVAAAASAGAPTAATAAAGSRNNLEMLLEELNALARELQKRTPSYRPPTYSPDALLKLVKQNIERFTPDVGGELISDLKANLEGTSPRDLANPDTWKGLWYILNYTAQDQTAESRAYVAERLSGLPGVSLAGDLWSNLEGTSPKEFLKPDTWKGLYYIVSYSVSSTASDLKHKLVGDNGDEEASG